MTSEQHMKVAAEREFCIQAGNCVMVAGEVFDQDDEGIVVVLTEEVTGESIEHARDAINLCPANALRFED